ncbi:putative N6-adenine-specific DNA methylase [Lachnospiraceae bacterium RM5]|nr:putative N6-adenine-specific DNA methylase [Lachnospiraceae bacterium RM5]
MDRYILIAPCHFGLESVLKREITDLGYEIYKVEDGKVSFYGDSKAICRCNIFLRTAERVMIEVGRFKAFSFDEFFEKVKKLEWERYIPKDGKFWVTKATSVKSKLFSTKDLQSLAKKAIVERLKQVYKIEWFEENGEEYPIRIFFNKDEAVVSIDTSGESLHKRGYRTWTSKAPISETLAAALIMLTPWKKDRILLDPFCGCGTFPIEAAMMAINMAPGMNRSFTAENWTNLIPKKEWYDGINEALDLIDRNVETDIQGSDIDDEVIKAARKNAINAEVDEFIHFQKKDVRDISHRKKYGFIITNPPYGERIEDKENLPELYKIIGEKYKSLDSWSAYIITSYEDALKYLGLKADKNRKIYNGMIKTYFYQFMGPKPPKKSN